MSPHFGTLLSHIMRTISDANTNLVDMSHDRLTVDAGRVRVAASLEMDGPEETRRLIGMLRRSGLELDILDGSAAVLGGA